MRKNTIVFLSLVVILIIGVIPICMIGRRNDIIAKTDKNNYNFAFNLDVISNDKQDRIEFISANGKNTKDLNITFVSDEKYCNIKGGKNMRTILCKCETKNNYTRIESLRLKINGKEREIKLRVPIENRTRSNIIFLKNH